MRYLLNPHGAAVTASAVESQIVGYMGSTLAGDNLNMMAVPFGAVGGDIEGLDLNSDAIKIENHSETDEPEDQAADFIQVWVPSKNGYDEFYYDAADGYWATIDGYYTPFIEVEGYENGFPAGSTAWYNASKDCDRDGALKITYSGAVESDPDVGYDDMAGDNLNMIANPYPVAIDLNNPDQILIENHSETDEPEDSAADFIQIWRPANNGYDEFYYDAAGGYWATIDGYYTPFIEVEGYTDGLPAGTAFWYNASSDCERDGSLKITFFNPLKK